MKKPVDEKTLREKLTPEEYAVCREGATERPFSGKYYHCDDEGTYRCVACDNALFKSDNKYDSGSGWPSFDRAIAADSVELRSDETHGMRRTEVLCKNCGSHLGHVFDDGPKTTGKRFCINSLSLKLDKK